MSMAIALVLRVLLSSIFARAALHKLRARDRFVTQLRAYRLLPAHSIAPTALALAIAEALVALSLLNPAWTLPGLFAAALLVVYGAAMAINLSQGRTDLDCGCGGPLAARTTIDWTLVMRNLVLASFALLIASTSARAVDASLWLIVLPASAAAILLYESSEQALANHQRALAWKR